MGTTNLNKPYLLESANQFATQFSIGECRGSGLFTENEIWLNKAVFTTPLPHRLKKFFFGPKGKSDTPVG